MNNRVPAGTSGTNLAGAIHGSDTWTAANVPSHTHTISAGGEHVHNMQSSSATNDSGNQRVVDNEHDVPDLIPTTLGGAHTHVINNNAGGGTSADNRQGTIYLTYIIKT